MDCWAYKANETVLAKHNLRNKVMQNINKFLLDVNAHTLSASYDNMELHPSLNADLIDYHSTDFNYFKKLYELHQYKNIWYLGLFWNRCIRTRELGYQVVSEYLQTKDFQCKLLAKPSCTLELKEVHPGKQHSSVYEQDACFEDGTITLTKNIAEDTYVIQGTNPDWNGKII